MTAQHDDIVAAGRHEAAEDRRIARKARQDHTRETLAQRALVTERLCDEVERLRGIERGWQHDRDEWKGERDLALARAEAAEAAVARVRALADYEATHGDALTRCGLVADRIREALDGRFPGGDL